MVKVVLVVLAAVLLLLAVVGVQGNIVKPTIPSAWNATLSGNLIKFFPFNAAMIQDGKRTRLNFELTKSGPNEGGMLFDLNSNTGYLFFDVALVCYSMSLTPKIINLLSWTYFEEAERCGASCWRYVSVADNESYSWIFKGQPAVIFSFEINPLSKGHSNMISVVRDVEIGPQDDTVFTPPSFCTNAPTIALDDDDVSMAHLLSALTAKSVA